MGANAQTAVPVFTAGQVLTAQQQTEINTGIPVFATTVTRDAAFGGAGEKALAEGQFVYIEDAPKRIQVYNGTAFVNFDVAWQAYTPTLTNVTIGNGTRIGRYARIGKTVCGYVKFTLGSTSSVTGRILISLPSTPNTNDAVTFYGTFLDAGVANYLGMFEAIGTEIYTSGIFTNGTYANGAATSATVPFTWTNTDNFLVTFVYEEA